MSLAALLSNLTSRVVQSSPAILTGVSVAGTIATAVLTGRASVKAYQEIEAVERHLQERLPAAEKVKLVWPLFVPPMTVGLVTVFSAISAQSISSKRTAVAMGLYSISERSLQEFQDKTREIHGEKKVEKIRDEIAADRVRNHEPDDFFARQIEIRGDGVGLCKDMFSDRYFVSSRNEIDAAVNATNAEMNKEGNVSLNFFYDQIGIGNIDVGDDVGWADGMMLEVQYTYVPAEDGSPCQAVTFKRQPFHDFHRIWR